MQPGGILTAPCISTSFSEAGIPGQDGSLQPTGCICEWRHLSVTSTDKSVFIKGNWTGYFRPLETRLRPSHGALTFPPEQGARPAGQDQPAAHGTRLQDILTHPGLWVEGAGEVQGRAVSYLGQLTERGLLGTACSKGAAGSVLGRPQGP